MRKILLLSVLLYSSFGFSDELVNNPMVGSLQYSGALFPFQNKLTNESANYSVKGESKDIFINGFNKNNTSNSNFDNSSTVNSKLYSGAQFPSQNEITGKIGEKPPKNNTNLNNPVINSKLYSGALFPQQNNY